VRGAARTAGLAGRLLKHRLKGQRLRHVTVEVTKRCNARCSFCHYWKEDPPKELRDYGPLMSHFDPLVVTLSGGEPLLREDIADVVRGLRDTDPVVYIGMVTNGALLTVNGARELRGAGLDQLTVSLDYAGPRHDRVRALPGLYAKIRGLLPELARLGFDSVTLNTVIKDDNLEEIPAILDLALESGVHVGFSSYCGLKTGSGGLMVSEANLVKLRDTIRLIRDYKRKYGVTRTSDYYLERVPEYFARGDIPGCLAGISWVQVTPSGEIKPCSELPVAAVDYRAYDPRAAAPVKCAACWYSCRGESQAPVTLQRIRELL
jgi:MoaA/NifB/PqqE/SkfB family radical SAM enzyme